MTTIHHLTNKAIAVTGLPEGAYDFRIDFASYTVLSWSNVGEVPDAIQLPEGDWIVLGMANKLTNDQWEEVAKRKSIYSGLVVFKYWNYNHPHGYTFDTATESGHSLLKSKGLHVSNPHTNFECPNQWCENGYIDQGYNEKWRCEYCQENEELEESAELLSNPLILIQ